MFEQFYDFHFFSPQKFVLLTKSNERKNFKSPNFKELRILLGNNYAYMYKVQSEEHEKDHYIFIPNLKIQQMFIVSTFKYLPLLAVYEILMCS